VVYWVSTAAAAGILVAAGVLYFGPGYFAKESSSDATPLEEAKAIRHVQKQLAEALGTLDETTAAYDEARRDLAEATDSAEKADTRIAQLEEAERISRLSATQLRGQLAAEKAARKADRELLKTASAPTRELADARKKLADATSKLGKLNKLQGELEKLRPRLLAATTEQARTRRMYDAAVAAKGKTENNLLLLKARQAAMLADLQRAYLAIAAPGHKGLAARQVAARRAKMTQRCAKLRKAVDRDSTRRVLDKVEVVLVRLDLVSAGDPASADAFAVLLGAGQVLQGINRELDDPPAAPAIRLWLMEAKLILTGADRVG